MSSRNYSSRKISPSMAGFTLIELLISLTIFSLLITVLYQAFSTASNVWSRQELFDENKARQVAIRRLLESDFDQLVSYSYRHPKGEYTFFAGTPAVLFYATRNGFGARHRDQHGLFFVCCYLQVEDNGSQTFRIYKSAFPEEKLLTAFEDFLQLESMEQKFWTLPEELSESSLKVISDISGAGFYYEQVGTFAAAGEEDVPAVAEQKWLVQRKFPEILRFSYQFQESWNHHYLRLDPFPDPAVKQQSGAVVKK